jgi:ABC-type nitrate/sulfonate/bicarbonate transport system substrate-binding protein
MKNVRSRMRRLRIVTAAAVGIAALALTSCSLEDGGASAAPDGNSGPGTISVGFLYDVHAANIWTLDKCEAPGLKVELNNFKQFAEVQRAFEGGQIDVAAMGYQNLAQMIGNGYEDFRVVAGVYTGAEHITVKAGSGITTWSDLVGKKVGIPPNSFVEMLFRSSMREAKVSLEDVEIVPFPGAGPPMLAALERGDIDAMVAWESNSATAAVQGIGEYPPFDIQEGEIGKATSALYVTEKLAKEHPDTVDALVKCVQERTEALSGDVDSWVTSLQEKTGVDEAVARQAVQTGEMDARLYQDSAEKIIKEFADNGLLQDTSDQVGVKFDYGPLERVTGKPKSELGAK